MIPDKDVQAAIDRLTGAGFGAWVVGGYVRDLLRGVKPQDADICTAALPDEVCRVFEGERVIPTGLKHGTVTVLWRGRPIEITTLRQESGYADHRRPDSVQFVTRLDEDLSRRDFTVNAMATDGRELTDLFDGQGDLSRRIIRCVGDAHRRFDEDALRILRALRFAAVLDFEIEPETAAAAWALKDSISAVSKERVRDELCKLLIGPAAGRVMRDYGGILDSAVGAELFTVEKAALCDSAPPRANLRLAALLYGHSDPAGFMRGLRFSNKDIEAVVGVIRGAGSPPPADLPSARRFMAAYGGNWRDIAALWSAMGRDTARAQALFEGIETRDDCVSIGQLAISGGDLAALGLQGAGIGNALEDALEAVMDGRVQNNKESLIDRVLRHPPAMKS